MTAQESKLSNAYESTITTALTADASGTTISVDAAPTDSSNTTITGSVVMYLVLNPDSDSQREYVKVTNISGTTLTVVRNIDTGGGGLRTHAAGAKIRQVAQAQHFDDIHDRIDKVINEDGSSLNTDLFLDEDDMVSDSATKGVTQQSVKAYVDSQVTAQDLDIVADTGTDSIDLDSETLTIAGGTGLETTSDGAGTVTVDIDSTVTTNDGTQTLTNKTIDSANNTITVDADEATVSNIEVDNLKSGVLDTDISTTSASDDTLPSAKAVKTYVDSQVTAQDLDFTADTGGAFSIDLDSETLTIAGGTGIETTADASNTVTIDIDSTVVTESSTDTLTNKSIDLTNNTLTGTLAEFQTAVSDATLVDLDDAQTLTNKTIDSATNTLTVDADEATVQNIEVDNLKSGVLDTDLTTVSASDDTLASAKAIKTYVDDQAAKIIDDDGDTQIQAEESVDEDKLRFDTAGVERAVMDNAGIALTTNGGVFQHNQTQAATYTIASGNGTVLAGPITITGTVTNSGTMVIL